MTNEQLILASKTILDANWRGSFSVPSGRLYPFQWNWDSGITSIGTSRFDLDRALLEMDTLFKSQWQNGMIPHIVFHSEKETTYFPNFDFWNTAVNAGAPQQPKTSGITQPAVHGFVLEYLLSRFPTEEKVVQLVKKLFPKVVAYHRFLYTYRDPNREGLMFMYHPWESGRDNSPLWDESMNRIEIDKDTLPAYTRRDTSIAAADERPTSDQYDRYVYLLELGKKHRYDGPGIAAESPFLIQDTLMNAILIKSNNSLIHIGEQLGLDVGELKEWQSQSKTAFIDKFWNEDLQTFTCYDLRGEKQIKEKEIGALLSLSAGIANNHQAVALQKYLHNLHERGFYLCPSFDVDSPHFDSKRYWRGPIWPHVNWMIAEGLDKYKFDKLAQIVRDDVIHLIREHGFYEYFESNKAAAANLDKGYGGDQFSWTASTMLELLNA